MYRRRQKSENCTGQDEDEELKEIKKKRSRNIQYMCTVEAYG
jgi:hypothetical protein